MYSYLTMLKGPRAGKHHVLGADSANLIGRGLDCQLVLSDPLCSRVHASIERLNGEWWIKDRQSRNGTYVNNQKTEDAQLVEGTQVRIGSVIFEFRQSKERPSDTGVANHTQTIIHDQSVPSSGASPGASPIAGLAINNVANFVPLYMLSAKLLECDTPDEVIRSGVELLRERTHATVVGFLWVSDDGQLKPKLVIPDEESGKVTLSDELTERVCRMGKAVRIDNQRFGDSDRDRSFADAICVPLIYERQTLGAIHVYLERGRFSQDDFELAINFARIMVVALAKARRVVLLELEHRRLLDKTAAFGDLLGDSKPMQELKSRIARVARATGCVLIRGESGAGKELVARAIHKASQRADRPLLCVNCAALPRDLMESQLFGHKKGAFTGAENDHQGWFQQAHTGTLFLDEVGEMTLDGQAKLLRILEGHPFLPLGSTKEVSVDVRVIAATNRDLREFVQAGKFREDLYYRMSVFELFLPPLRDRGGDILMLVDYFLAHFCQQHGRLGLKLSDAARTRLLSYQWPGNVRQLRNVIDSAVVMADGDEIELDDLAIRDVSPLMGNGDARGSESLESLELAFWEKKLMKMALQRTNGNVPEAAKLLGIGRATLYRRMEEFGLSKS